ncbi:MAG TPA: fructosamine kinase family protein [Thermomicrobiales bacterium]|nr:fructosamine kinase family protein [Thermomicrobiales bacterium]
MDHAARSYESLETRVGRIIGDTVTRSRTLTGGKMGDVVQIAFESHAPVVAKSASPYARLALEAHMLRHLRDAGTIPVPEVLFASDDLLILEHMPGVHLQPSAEPHCGSLLAKLHNVTGDAYGFDSPTLNGRIVLSSPWTESWVEFYRRHRLGFALDLADEYQQLPGDLRDALDRILDCLPRLIREPEYPSLIHGDLWAANVLSDGDRVTAFLDPSACYGDPEIELAYVDAWNSFGQGFWDAYTESRPVDAGFYRVRRHVYALYPLLMHVYYFGDRFLPRLRETIAAIVPHM